MELLQTKSLLAKLMATENLIVEQKNVATAFFDVENRVLVLPILDKNISGHLYDLLVGHEVGHALYTSMDGLEKAKNMGLSMSLMNILEDSRIERKIKQKYPGIRVSFIQGYSELIEKDFFRTAGVNLNTLNFVDRINLFCKGGPSQGIIFSDYEKELLKQIETTSTYDDVITVAKKVTEYIQNKNKKKKEKKQLSENIIDPDELASIPPSFSAPGETEDELQDETEEELPELPEELQDETEEELPEFPEEFEESEDDDEEDDGEDEESEEDDEEEDEEITSFTDEAYQANQRKLYQNDGQEYYYGNIPNFDLANFVVPHKELWNKYKEELTDCSSYYQVDTGAYRNLRQDSAKVVSYLAKEFEMRKNANQIKRTTISKTGELNMNKVFSYHFSEDLFKKATITPDGKSHGLVMFLDWSSSMSTHLLGTVKQLINLCLFCKKVNIPFDVYAFSSEYGFNGDDENPNQGHIIKEGDIQLRTIKLLNMLSSKMNAAEFSFAGAALLTMARGYTPYSFNLGGTPLNETIMLAMDIIPKFKKQNNLQIVNTVFLTDGEGHWNRRVWRNENGSTFALDDFSYKKSFVICDTKTKNQEFVYESDKTTAAYLKLLKLRTGCNIVGFYVLSSKDIKNVCYRHNQPTHQITSIKSQFRKNKYLIFKNVGYDEYYLLNSDEMNTDVDDDFEVKSKTTKGLVSAFSKYRSNRLSNRVVLNQFIGMIS